ncbi:MAG: FHA domain-containing protein [Isosphaeraceae bacterium]
MRYALRIVRGRSNAKMLKLIDGVTSLGRHDDCLIRVRSSQVSRRHCEIYEHDGTLMIRDLDSSNGTFVNGKRVLGQQALSPGDVLTIGTVTLSVDLLRPARESIQTPPVSAQKSEDTAEMRAAAKGSDREPLEAIEDEELEIVEDDDSEFEVAIDDESQHPDLIPLEDEKATSLLTNSPKPAVAGAAKAAQVHPEQSKPPRAATNLENQSSEPESSPADDDAVAQFLMDLKLDDD